MTSGPLSCSLPPLSLFYICLLEVNQDILVGLNHSRTMGWLWLSTSVCQWSIRKYWLAMTTPELWGGCDILFHLLEVNQEILVGLDHSRTMGWL
jgi:hypothetical protein